MLDPDKKRNSQRDTVMRVKTSWFLPPPYYVSRVDTFRFVVGERITAEEVTSQKR